ncbi:MAG: signal peptidase II [Clostridia bacterium]|nr:signal peptidase II [Clostridia bacterium]
MPFFVILIIIIGGGVVLDQVSKLLVDSLMERGESIAVIEDVFHLTYVQNRGAAFGMLSDSRWVFMILSTIGIIALCVYLFRFCKESNIIKIGLALVISGGIGNMIDRTLRGFVVDMIDMRFVRIYNFAEGEVTGFYVFNIADSFVCIGIAITVIWLIKEIICEFKNKKKADKKDENNA